MRPAELLRSSTFRLAVLYMILFAGSASMLLGFIYWSTVAFMSEQVDTTIETEIQGLAEQYQQRGLNGLVSTINDRVERRKDSAALYLFASPTFRPLAGNLTGWPEEAPSEDGWLDFEIEDPRGNLDNLYARARVFVLTGNFKLLVGRDVRELHATQNLIIRALLWGLAITVALALIGGVMVSRTVLRRLEDINTTSQEIMAGDLGRRVPTRGTSDDFDQLAGNLNAMLDEIERLMAGIRHVSDNIAHDLRTPLTRLRHRLEGLEDESLTAEVRQAQVEQAITDADQLLGTFSALLRITRMEAGGYQPSFRKLVLRELIEDAADLYQVVAEEKDLALSTDVLDDTPIEADGDLLFQALTNLIDNAIKFTPEGGTIRVATSRRDNAVVLSVADSGPGIPEAERDRVVERFYRTEASRSTAGSGLGLSLVAAIAAVHQADLALSDNQPGLKVTLRFSPAD
jgi:signal transduction histidine kinase